MITKDRKTTYFASKLSDNISETPEGYLICHNVPIARTGVQEYLGQEIGLSDKYDQWVKVYREPEDVFDPAAMASFEGKPLADEHPEPKIDINNINMYSKGHAQNIRRSIEEPDLLLADIVAQDSLVIQKIKDKLKRDISSGYDCYYVPYKDGYRQVEIRGNHIALVTKGRAGDRVSIKDSKSERKRKMAKKNILAAMLKAFARDAEPEEIAEAMEAMKEEKPSKDADTPVVKKEEIKSREETVEDDDPLEGLSSRLAQLEEKLNKLYSAEKSEGHENLDEDPEVDMEDEDMEDPEEEVDEEEEVVTSKDSLTKLKRSIASIRSSSDRRRVSDAFRKVYGKNSTSNVYGRINRIINNRHTNDSSTVDLTRLGKDIAEKFNPHYKKENN